MAPDNYIVAISKPSTWGGAIELNILANHYATEIASVDVETGRIDQFTTDTAVNRCIVIYSGIHYDAATLAPMLEAPGEWHQTVFPLVSYRRKGMRSYHSLYLTSLAQKNLTRLSRQQKIWQRSSERNGHSQIPRLSI